MLNIINVKLIKSYKLVKIKLTREKTRVKSKRSKSYNNENQYIFIIYDIKS